LLLSSTILALAGAGCVRAWSSSADRPASSDSDLTSTSDLTTSDLAVSDLTATSVGGARIAAGDWSSCGITSDGHALCWGRNENDNLGVGAVTSPVSAPQAVAGGHLWSRIGVMDSGGCGLRVDQVAMCWGTNATGDLGIGTSGGASSTPVAVSGGHRWSTVSFTGGGGCGIRTDGALLCWGNNSQGQLADGTTTHRSAPMPVLPGSTWRYLSNSAWSAIVCALRTSGEALCWGNNLNGAVGNGVSGSNQLTPQKVLGGHSWIAISAGGNHSCGVRVGGSAMCWGANTSGELGDGTTTSAVAPVLVAGGYLWKDLRVSYRSTCGLRTDGQAMCWGEGATGALGTGSPADSKVPVPVTGGHLFTELGGGGNQFFGRRADGVLMSWGRNQYGELGVGSVGGLFNVPQVVAGGHPW